LYRFAPSWGQTLPSRQHIDHTASGRHVQCRSQCDRQKKRVDSHRRAGAVRPWDVISSSVPRRTTVLAIDPRRLLDRVRGSVGRKPAFHSKAIASQRTIVPPTKRLDALPHDHVRQFVWCFALTVFARLKSTQPLHVRVTRSVSRTVSRHLFLKVMHRTRPGISAGFRLHPRSANCLGTSRPRYSTLSR